MHSTGWFRVYDWQRVQESGLWIRSTFEYGAQIDRNQGKNLREISLLKPIQNFGLVRFGAETEVVSRFGEEMNDQLGGEVVEKFTFEQQSTNVIEMLDFTSRYVELFLK